MMLLQRHGVELLSAVQCHARLLSADQVQSSLAIEARLALATVKTVVGARLVAGQTEGGLGRLCRRWLDEAVSLDDIKARGGPGSTRQ